MKLKITYTKNSVIPFVNQILEVDRVAAYEGMLNLYKSVGIGVMLFRSINLNEIVEWQIVEDTVTQYELNAFEDYLKKNKGNLRGYYSHLSTGAAAGTAFYYNVNTMDKIILDSKMSRQAFEQVKTTDNLFIKRIIELLKEEQAKYPEDHPLWTMR